MNDEVYAAQLLLAVTCTHLAVGGHTGQTANALPGPQLTYTLPRVFELLDACSEPRHLEHVQAITNRGFECVAMNHEQHYARKPSYASCHYEELPNPHLP